MRILLVEDNLLLRHHLGVQLQELGHLVDSASDAQEADYYCQEHELDLAIVDLGLPDEDGLSLITRWRQHGIAFPILILTAREAWEDKVKGLEAGADDYVTKPFQLEEVVARINALVRRASGLASSLIQAPPYLLDLSRKELKINDEVVKLTAFEYQILEFLMRRSGEVISKDTLMFQLYADAELRETHTIDVLMGRLRRKMQLENQPDAIQTVRGQGYRFDMPT
jgi:two-component system response regulator PhoP